MAKMLKAEVRWRESGVGVFDPLTLYARLQHEFPVVEMKILDYLENTTMKIIDLAISNGNSGAARIALRDWVERGPILQFYIKSHGVVYSGVIDRQRVEVRAEEGFNDEIERRFRSFLDGLKMPAIDISETQEA